MKQLKFPDLDGDHSPGTLCWDIIKAIQRRTGKMAVVEKRFLDITEPLPLQEETLNLHWEGGRERERERERETERERERERERGREEWTCMASLLRMGTKVQTTVKSLTDLEEKLTQIYSQGLVHGYKKERPS